MNIQKSAQRIVEHEVYLNMTPWVEYVANAHDTYTRDCPIDPDDIPYILPCEHCDGTGETESGEACPECDGDGEVIAEVYEWYAVSGWLAGHLEEQGEVIIDGPTKLWGRQAAGQAICLDYCIEQIALDLEGK